MVAPIDLDALERRIGGWVDSVRTSGTQEPQRIAYDMLNLIAELRASRKVVEATRLAVSDEPAITRAEFAVEYRALVDALAELEGLK